MAKHTVVHDRRLRKAKEQSLSAETVRSLLHYDPDTGIFTWKARPIERFRRFGTGWNKKWAGKRAGCINEDGYLQLNVDNRRFLGHRLAWLYMTGQWPEELIDHINGDPGDNRFCNLREATNAENLFNKFVHLGVSGKRGVHFHKSSGMWQARITHNYREISLGYFHDKEHAAVAYRTAARIFYGAAFYRATGLEDNPAPAAQD